MRSALLLFLGFFSFLPGLQAKPPNQAAETQCVYVAIEAFNLLPDPSCSISSSKLIAKVPDQNLLYDLGLGSAKDTCFSIVTDVVLDENGEVIGAEFNIPGVISDGLGGERFVTLNGVAGLTENAYLGISLSNQALSFTAISVIKVSDGSSGQMLGSFITRDAGTVFIDSNTGGQTAAAQLSIVKGDGVFSGSTGYLNELGEEFNYDDPATATGTFCGRGLADALTQ